jgi:peptidoglycan/xylan/chitin deacetylase (PgdA/CDA1 family)
MPWYDNTIYEWIIPPGFNIAYVPITVFEELSGFSVIKERNNKEITLTSGAKSFTFNIKNKSFAYTEDQITVYMRIFEFRTGTIWVPAVPVCEHFGLKFEQAAVNDSNFDDVAALRISDGSTKKSLADLLKDYGLKETTEATETTAPPNTDDTVTTDTEDPDPVIGDRLIFLTFDDAINEYTDGIIDLLNEYGVHATFFVVGDSLYDGKAVNTLLKIITGKHSIGLHTMTHNEDLYKYNIQSFVDELNAENELLYALTKQKTRIARAPEGSSTAKFFISDDDGRILKNAGYTIWDWNVFVPDDSLADDSIVNAVKSGIMKYSIPVVRLYSSKATLEALPAVLEYITENVDFKTAAINDADVEINFIGKLYNQ